MPFEVIQEVRHHNLSRLQLIVLYFISFCIYCIFYKLKFRGNLASSTCHFSHSIIFKLRWVHFFFFRQSAIPHLMTAVGGICNFHMLWETKIFTWLTCSQYSLYCDGIAWKWTRSIFKGCLYYFIYLVIELGCQK